MFATKPSNDETKPLAIPKAQLHLIKVRILQTYSLCKTNHWQLGRSMATLNLTRKIARRKKNKRTVK